MYLDFIIIKYYKILRLSYLYIYDRMLQEKLVEIEDCLWKRRWVKHCLRTNIVPESMIQ